ncbi:MAG: glycoside hydrolase family 31 protein [Prevotellaceae bacterium]|jgi:alpha-glucosidase|nr:glycoside hydrolase family 31 protein [Prevotellaceae bacterium]
MMKQNILGMKDAGNVLTCKVCETGIVLHCENADVQISVYSPAIVRVDVSFSRMFDAFSYAVEVAPQENLHKFHDNSSFIEIETDNFITVINRHPFAVAFKTLAGEIINCDEPGLYNSQVENHVTAYKTLQKGERFIGLGEKCGGLDKRAEAYTNINTDSFAYGTGTDPLYTTFPFYIGLHNGLCYGIFLDNTYQSDFNFGASNNRFSSFGARGGNLNYYFIHHPAVNEIIESYTHLTGRMPLPPLWSLGYHQNRYSYYPDTEVLRIAETLREKKIPCDSITLDIHYMDEYKLFTWDRTRFANPEKLLDKLKDKGFRTTVIVDPGIKSETADNAGDIFLKYIDGQDYEGKVWPGWCKFPDFTNPEAVKWWHDSLKTLIDNGVAGIWNDMNEISTWGQKMPDNIVFHFDGEKASHLKARNIYGLQMARASYEGYVKHCKSRPFILTRSGFSGVQRYSAVWTGDNTADDGHLLLGVRMLMSMGITGVAFTGMDIGGFLGESSTNLYARWVQIGAFIPYMRNHKQINTKSSEPWTYGEEVLEIARNYISLRYRLLPYIYSTFREASLTGMPVMRTLAIKHAFDDVIYNKLFENQYYFGDAFLVAPFDSIQKYGEIYFPEGERYNFYDDSIVESQTTHIEPLSLHRLPVYVNESSIIPMQDVVQHTGANSGNTLYVHIYKGKKANVFTYYEDDGESFDYRYGAYCERKIRYNPLENSIILDAPKGNFRSKFTRLKFILHGFGNIDKILFNDTLINVSTEKISFLDPISAFEPQAEIIALGECEVKCFETGNEV